MSEKKTFSDEVVLRQPFRTCVLSDLMDRQLRWWLVRCSCHDGYMPFQHAASLRLNDALGAGRHARDTVRELNAMFRESLAA